MNKIDTIILHHVGFNHSFYTVNSYHKKKYNMRSSLGWYAGYTYFIDNSGKVFQARKEGETGAHKKGWNERSIGICLRGNLDKRKMTNQQAKSLRELLLAIKGRHKIENIYGHRELSATICPGKYGMEFLEAFRKGYTEEVVRAVKEPKTTQKATSEPVEPNKQQLQTQLDKIKAMIERLKKFLLNWKS